MSGIALALAALRTGGINRIAELRAVAVAPAASIAARGSAGRADPQRGQKGAGQAAGKPLQRLPAGDAAGQIFGQLVEFVTHSLLIRERGFDRARVGRWAPGSVSPVGTAVADSDPNSFRKRVTGFATAAGGRAPPRVPGLRPVVNCAAGSNRSGRAVYR